MLSITQLKFPRSNHTSSPGVKACLLWSLWQNTGEGITADAALENTSKCEAYNTHQPSSVSRSSALVINSVWLHKDCLAPVHHK